MTETPPHDTSIESNAEQPNADRTVPDSDPTESVDSTESTGELDPGPNPAGPGAERRIGDVWELLAWGALAICSLLAIFAVIRFYGSVTEAIDIWVEPRHQPLTHAAFNLVVLFGSLIGISLLVRELG